MAPDVFSALEGSGNSPGTARPAATDPSKRAVMKPRKRAVILSTYIRTLTGTRPALKLT